MSAAFSLQMLIGTALTDTGFRSALLNGSRRRILQSLPLSGEEIETIMAIKADSLEQFAGELHRQLLADGDEPEPLPPLHRTLSSRRHTAKAPEEPESVPNRHSTDVPMRARAASV